MYKLVIADDEAVERQAIRFFVENSHLDISDILECANGTTLIQTALAEKPDIIITDIKMPGFTGLEAVEHIHSANKNCKVIFSTAYNYFDYAVKAMQLGSMDFMVKPVKKETLIAVLTKAIDQLDYEKNQLEKSQKIEITMRILGKRILVDLLKGKFDEETLYYLDHIGVDSNSHGRAVYIKLQQPLGDEKAQRALTILKEDLNSAGYKSIAHISGNEISFVVFSATSSLPEKLSGIIEVIISSLFRDLKTEYEFGIGTEFKEISEIEASYINACAKVKNELVSIETDFAVSQPSTDTALPPEIQTICSYINDNYAQKITLDSIGEIVGFSKFYISRLFKQYMGITIFDYIIQVRLSRAKALLKESEYSIKQISDMIGYSDSNYFIWAFKKQEGVSPSKYRYSQNN